MKAATVSSGFPCSEADRLGAMSRADAATETEKRVCFDDLVSKPQQEADALDGGYGWRAARQLGRIGTGLECIEALSRLRRRFDVEHSAVADGNPGSELSAHMEDSLIESIGLIASFMQDDLADVIRNGRKGAPQ